MWAVEQIHDRVQQELSDPDHLRRQQVCLRLRYEMDELDEAAYREQEATS